MGDFGRPFSLPETVKTPRALKIKAEAMFRKKYTQFKYDLSKFDNEDETYDYVKLAYSNESSSSAAKKVLFVLDFVPKEDLESGRLLSGVTGDLLENLLDAARKMYGQQQVAFNWLAVTHDVFRTRGKPAEFVAAAKEAFAERVKKLIARYKPDYVVAFGTRVMDSLIADKIGVDDNGRKRYTYWMGVPVPRKEGDHRYALVSNLSLDGVVRGDSAEAYLLGFMCRNLAPLYGKWYHVDGEKLAKTKPVFVDTYAKFTALMDKVESIEGPVAVDTEARSLYRVTNKLYVVQFAYNAKVGFVIPIYHKDSPFTPRELEKIIARLKKFFEGNNKNAYHIYVNAKFDLTLLRMSCGVGYFANDLFDIQGASFALDENKKFLQTVLGEGYYSLSNLAVQYGFEGYLTADFNKSDRKNFTAADLTSYATQFYCALDVCVPYAIHEVMIQEARDLKYTKFMSVVKGEISDTLHAFSVLENEGALVDTNYLFHLRSDKSPIESVIRSMTDELLGTDAAKKAAARLSAKKGIQTASLWGSDYEGNIRLNLRKAEDKKLLFFDILKLEPLELGAVDKKTGKAVGKLDKKFQSHYKKVPEVAAYTALEKAKKLRNAYVKSFIRMLGDNADFQFDHRIRPHYGYLGVVTHRGSASDPNLQQVPSHSELGKHIKRLFIARPGCLYVKVDYKAHEVRGWGIVAFDKAIAQLFGGAKKLYDEYRLRPNKDLKKRLKTEADIHIMNAGYFFGMNVADVTADIRSAVKSVVFGVIYQKSAKSLARDLDKEVEFTEDLMTRMFKRFAAGKKWIDDTKKFARQHMYVEAPIGIRRRLWGYLLPKSHPEANRIYGEMDRRSVNSPIQGMCSKFMMNGVRVLARGIYEIRKLREDFEFYINNSVHDSLENEAGYKSIIKSIAVLEWSLTEGVKRAVKKRHGFDLISVPEVDFEIGASLSQAHSWDFSVESLERLVMDSLIFQRNELKYNINVDRVHDIVFDQVEPDGPAWMKQQVKNLDYKFDLTESKYIREIREEGKASVASAQATLAELGDVADDDEDRLKAKKKAEEQLAEGEKMLERAKDLRIRYDLNKQKGRK